MAISTCFSQACPTCGRQLQVKVALLGKKIACPHCHAQFEARDPASRTPLPDDSSILVLQRANELLAAAAMHRERAG